MLSQVEVFGKQTLTEVSVQNVSLGSTLEINTVKGRGRKQEEAQGKVKL